jgi:hypothetical protein
MSNPFAQVRTMKLMHAFQMEAQAHTVWVSAEPGNPYNADNKPTCLSQPYREVGIPLESLFHPVSRPALQTSSPPGDPHQNLLHPTPSAQTLLAKLQLRMIRSVF